MSTTPKTPVTTTTTPPTIDRHLELAIEDLAATGRSTAAERALRIAREEIDQLLARTTPTPSRRPRPLPCPCALGGLWRGVPRARRRHAVLCELHPGQQSARHAAAPQSTP